MAQMNKQVVLYFANWNLKRGTARHSGEVCSLPWAQISYLNHAFWALRPRGGDTETSFQRRGRGAAPRTEWEIVSLNPDIDEQDNAPSAVEPALPRNHFAQYAQLHRRWPEVKILISIGGWTRCGYFSEMASTRAGRESFIESCIALLCRCGWLAGLDIDWEYPACERPADARDPDGDEGCPVYESAVRDRENFTALLRELRAAMDDTFGKNEKKLTACASGAPMGALAQQSWADAAPYLDFINIMSYDLAGAWEGISGYASCAAKAAAGAEFLTRQGVPAEKICIGAPLYGTVMRLQKMPEPGERIVGAPVEPEKPSQRLLDQTVLRSLAQQDAGAGRGWHAEYDEENGAAWMYCDDAESEYARWFISYESRQSLAEKLKLIHGKNLGGVIVWEADEDTEQFEFLTQMGESLRNTNQ